MARFGPGLAVTATARVGPFKGLSGGPRTAGWLEAEPYLVARMTSNASTGGGSMAVTAPEASAVSRTHGAAEMRTCPACPTARIPARPGGGSVVGQEGFDARVECVRVVSDRVQHTQDVVEVVWRLSGGSWVLGRHRVRGRGLMPAGLWSGLVRHLLDATGVMGGVAGESEARADSAGADGAVIIVPAVLIDGRQKDCGVAPAVRSARLVVVVAVAGGGMSGGERHSRRPTAEAVDDAEGVEPANGGACRAGSGVGCDRDGLTGNAKCTDGAVVVDGVAGVALGLDGGVRDGVRTQCAGRLVGVPQAEGHYDEKGVAAAVQTLGPASGGAGSDQGVRVVCS